MEPVSSWMLVGFVNHGATTGTPGSLILNRPPHSGLECINLVTCSLAPSCTSSNLWQISLGFAVETVVSSAVVRLLLNTCLKGSVPWLWGHPAFFRPSLDALSQVGHLPPLPRPPVCWAVSFPGPRRVLPFVRWGWGRGCPLRAKPWARPGV